MRLELVGQRLELKHASCLRVAFEQARAGAQQLEVDLDLLDRPRPANLDDDLSPVSQESRMDLGNGRGREWLGVDTDEDVGSELLVDDRLDQLEGLRRHLVDEPRE